MKWCFLLNNARYLMELLGKLSEQALKEGDECIVVANSKITEYDMRKYFPKEVKFLSKVDWCIENYKKGQEDFGNLSWKEFFPTFDRKTKLNFFKFNYCNSVEIVSQLYQFVKFLLEKEKPDLVINEPPVDAFKQTIYHFCKKNNITYLGLMGSRIDGRMDIYDLACSSSKYRETFNKLTYQEISSSEKKFARDFIEDFISHKQLPSGTDYALLCLQRSDLMKYYTKRLGEVYQSRFRYLKKRKKFKPFDYESEAILKSSFRAPINAFRRKFRSISQKNIFKFINNNDKYFFFPLHFQPEFSTSVCATFFCDQLTAIKNIAFSLPFSYKLYVKEHTVAVGTRSTAFYRELKKIPNVVLISPYESVARLVGGSKGVITLTGTIGMEAALAGKPVYIFGDVFYVYHPLCKKMNNFDELRCQLQKDLINKPAIDNLEETNIRFIVSYLRNTILGNLLVAGTKNDINSYKDIYENIKRGVLKNR